MNLIIKVSLFLALVHCCVTVSSHDSLRLKRQSTTVLNIQDLIERVVREQLRANTFPTVGNTLRLLIQDGINANSLAFFLGLNMLDGQAGLAQVNIGPPITGILIGPNGQPVNPQPRIIDTVDRFRDFIFGPIVSTRREVIGFVTQLERIRDLIRGFVPAGSINRIQGRPGVPAVAALPGPPVVPAVPAIAAIPDQVLPELDPAVIPTNDERNRIINQIINRVTNELNGNFDLRNFLNGDGRSFPIQNRNLPRNQNAVFQDLIDFLNRNQ